MLTFLGSFLIWVFSAILSGGPVGRNPPATQGTRVQSLGQEDPLGKGMAPHSSVLAWRIPWTEEPGWLQLTGSQRVGRDWATSLWLTMSPQIMTTQGKDQVYIMLLPLSCFSRAQLFVTPWTIYSPPGSSVHGILQARILEWVAISYSRGSSWPKDRTWVSCIAGSFLTVWATREAHQSGQTQFLSPLVFSRSDATSKP